MVSNKVLINFSFLKSPLGRSKNFSGVLLRSMTFFLNGGGRTFLRLFPANINLRLSHLSKTSKPNSSTLSGIKTTPKFLHPAKALSSISTTLSGIIRLVNPKQSQNAFLSTTRTPFGISSCNLSQPANSPSKICMLF